MNSDGVQHRRTILLVGNYRATVTLTRELGRQGHKIIVGCGGDEEGGAEHSRYCTQSWTHPPAVNGISFLNALRELLLAEPGISVVLPTSERYVRLLNAHRTELPEGRIYAMPGYDAVSVCLDKAKLLELAARANVPVAPFRNVTDFRGLREAAEELGFPLAIRPDDSMKRLFGLKAVICRGPADMNGTFASWPSEHERLLVQSKVSGRRHNVYFAAERGSPIRLLEAVVLQTDKPDGTGLAVAGETRRVSGEMRRYTTNLLAKLSYHGVGCAQYLVDAATGQTHFLEINPRIAGHHAIAERAGLGLSALAVELVLREELNETLREGAAGIRYAWTYGELRSLKSRFASGEIGLFGLARGLAGAARSAVRADMHVTRDSRDPNPTFRTYWNAFAPRARRDGRAKDQPVRYGGSAVDVFDR